MPKTKKDVYTVTLSLPDGSRKYYRGKTKKEAEAKRAKDKALLGQGIDIQDDSTFETLANIWYELYKADRGHIRSQETVRGTLQRYVIPALGKYAVKEIRPAHIQKMMKDYKDYSHSTQKKILEATKAIFRMAVENDLILKSPCTSTIKAEGNTPEEVEPLTPDQSERLLKALEGTRAHLLVNILLNAGLRIGEALGLMWADVDFDEGKISVKRSIVYPTQQKQGVINTDLKTANARREVWLPWSVIEELRTEKAKSSSLYVFSMANGSYLSESSFRKLWALIDYRTIDSTVSMNKKKQFVERTLDFKVHPHQLRHTCITRWFEKGLDIKEVQYLAGHATPDITLRIYTHYQRKIRGSETASKIRGETALKIVAES